MKPFDIRLLPIICIVFFYSINLNAQTTFFKHDSNNMYSTAFDVKEYNGYFYITGAVSNNEAPIETRQFKPFLYKINSFGDIIQSYVNTTDTSRYCFPKLLIEADTLMMFYGFYNHQTHLSSIKVDKFDLNFDTISKKSYELNDSLIYTICSINKDESNNLLVSMGKSLNRWLMGSFMAKFSPDGDTLVTKASGNHIPYLLDIPDIDKYYCFRENNYLDIYNRSLIKTGQINLMDTFFSYYYSGVIVGEDSILMIGDRILTWGQPGYDNRSNIIFKSIDYQGNILSFYEINTPDTISHPLYDAVTFNGTNVYFAWNKGLNSYTQSKIGVGKFNKSLQPEWIKYFGKSNTQYYAHKVTSTADGGCLVVGEYRKMSFVNDDWRYFILKVNSAGLATFMKHTDIKVQNTVNIYPNPAVDEVTITLINQMQSIKEIAVFDIQGKEVLNKQSNSAEIKLDVSGLSSGVYLIKGKTNTGLSFGRKFVKE